MRSGRTLLRAWLARSKQNQRQFAKAIGVSDGYLSQILSGLRRPKLELLIHIEALTGVPVGAWADTKRSKLGNTRKHSEDRPNVYR